VFITAVGGRERIVEDMNVLRETTSRGLLNCVCLLLPDRTWYKLFVLFPRSSCLPANSLFGAPSTKRRAMAASSAARPPGVNPQEVASLFTSQVAAALQFEMEEVFAMTSEGLRGRLLMLHHAKAQGVCSAQCRQAHHVPQPRAPRACSGPRN
jgi:hypothetical protein